MMNVYRCRHVRATAHAQRSEGNSLESVLSFHRIGPRDTRLGSNCLYLLTYFCQPITNILIDQSHMDPNSTNNPEEE